MFSKAVFTLAFFAVAQFASAASPPGCMLGAINTYETPSDISSVCKEKDASSKIAKYCGDSTQQALSSFADVCKAQGVEVSTDIPSSTASAKASSTKGANATGSITDSGATTFATATATGNSTLPGAQNTGAAGTNGVSPPPSGTATGGPAQSTGAAGRLEVAGAALLAGLVMAAL